MQVFTLVTILGIISSVLCVPADTPPRVPAGPLTLNGQLVQVNETTVNITLTNDNAIDIALLKHHSLLTLAEEHHSLTVLPGNGGQPLHPGESMVYSMYVSATAESFHTLGAGSSWSRLFDLTALFKVTRGGNYQVSMQRAFPGVQASDPSIISNLVANPITAQAFASQLDSIKMECDILNVTLPPSSTPQFKTLRPRDSNFHCSGHEERTVSNAISSAKVLAQEVYANRDENLWTRYFNGSTKVRETVWGVYNAIANFNVSGSTDIHLQCDSNNTTPTCKIPWVAAYASGVYAPAVYTPASGAITFCSTFFSVPLQTACRGPGPTDPHPADQPGIVIHEMTHLPTLVGPGLETRDLESTDGNGGFCYSYSCATTFAKDRAPALLPEGSAINYELYAYAVRNTDAVKDGKCESSDDKL